MALKDQILEFTVAHWIQHFGGVSAVRVAEKLNLEHEEVLAAFYELHDEGKGEMNKDVKLYSYPLVGNEDEDRVSAFGGPQEIITSIFFPARQVLEDYYYGSDLSRQGIPEYLKRLHFGLSQIKLFYFDTAVLRKYVNHPEFYVVDDSASGGILSSNSDYVSEATDEVLDSTYIDRVRFGRRQLQDGRDSLTALLIDLAQLSPADQRHWHAWEIENPVFAERDPHFARYFLRNFEGAWIDYDDPLQKTMATINRINAIIGNDRVFSREENPYLAYPVTNSAKNFCDCCSELYKIVGPDNLNTKTLKNLLQEYFGFSEADFIHADTGRQVGKRHLLKILTERVCRRSSLIETLDEIKEHRTSADHRILEPQILDKNYLAEFRTICVSLSHGFAALAEGLQLIMNPMTREEAFQNLESWSKSLAQTVEEMLPQIRETLESETELPEGCPSKESAASLIFRQIEKKLAEVNAAATMVETTIWK